MAHKSWLAVTCVVIALVAGVAYWQVAGRKTDSTALSGDSEVTEVAFEDFEYAEPVLLERIAAVVRKGDCQCRLVSQTLVFSGNDRGTHSSSTLRVEDSRLRQACYERRLLRV